MLSTFGYEHYVSLENMNVEEIARFSIAELKEKLKELRLPSSGLKAVLQE